MVLLDCGFHTEKNFSKNYLQFADVHSKNFCQSRPRLKKYWF